MYNKGFKRLPTFVYAIPTIGQNRQYFIQKTILSHIFPNETFD